MKKTTLACVLSICLCLELNANDLDIMNGGVPVGLSDLESSVMINPDPETYVLAEVSNSEILSYISYDAGISFDLHPIAFGPYTFVSVQNLESEPRGDRIFFIGHNGANRGVYSVKFNDGIADVTLHSDSSHNVDDYSFLGEDDDSFCIVYTTQDATYYQFLSQDGSILPAQLFYYAIELNELNLRPDYQDGEIIYSGLFDIRGDGSEIQYTTISSINGYESSMIPSAFYVNNEPVSVKFNDSLFSVYMDNNGQIVLFDHNPGISQTINHPKVSSPGDVEKVFFTPIEPGFLVSLFINDSNSLIQFYTALLDFDGNLTELNNGLSMNQYPIDPQHIYISEYGFPYFVSFDGVDNHSEIMLFDSTVSNSMMISGLINNDLRELNLVIPDESINLLLYETTGYEFYHVNGTAIEKIRSIVPLDAFQNHDDGLTESGDIFSIRYIESFTPPLMQIDNVRFLSSDILLIENNDGIYMLKAGENE